MSEASERALEILDKAQDVSSGSRRVSQHQLSGVSQLLKALRDEPYDGDAVSQPHRGLRFTKLVPPGCG